MIKFTVRGNGQFPLDMLRYDRCWPATEFEVVKIKQHLEPGPMKANLDSIRLETSDSHAPTSQRWASFGWVVS